MKRTVSAIAADLATLERADFDGPDAIDQLNFLCDELSSLEVVSEVAPVMFHFIERMPDADLGSPGPLVHTLEAMPGYEPFLRQSVMRNPTQLTLWMVNRIANARRSDWLNWVELLEAVTQNPRVASSVRQEAQSFVEVQRAA